MKKVLIIGGSYFIGYHITKIFADSKKYSVYTLNRCTKDINLNIQKISADRNSYNDMYSNLRGLSFDFIIDVSGVEPDQISILLKCVDISNVRKIVYISSSSVYNSNYPAPYDENALLGNNQYWGQYGENKLLSERVFQDKIKDKSKLLILRLPYVYGENNYVKRESYIFYRLINNLPIIIPKGNSRIQFIYVTDIAQAIYNYIENEIRLSSSIINLYGKEVVSFREWCNACAYVIHKKAKIIECKNTEIDCKLYFPFHNYDNYLISNYNNSLISNYTSLLEGLIRSWKWLSISKEGNKIINEYNTDTKYQYKFKESDFNDINNIEAR